MRKFLLNAQLLLLFGVLLSSNAIAQIVTFDFVGKTGSEVSVVSNTNNTKLTPSTITRGSGVTASGKKDRFNSTSWSATPTIDLTDYLEFTITPAARKKFTISTVMLQHQRSGTGPKTFVIRTSLDNYATNACTEVVIADVTSTLSSIFTLNLPSQNQPVIIRLYGYNAEGTTGLGSWGPEGPNDDIIVNGTTDIDVLNTETDITSFSIPQQTSPATINPTNHTVNIEVAYGTSVTALVPTIGVSDGATISPTSAAAQNFSAPITYNVTAEDGLSNQPWTITVSVSTVEPGPAITSLTPTNKEVGVATNIALSITFNTGIQTKSGFIRIYKAVNDQEIAAVNVANTTIKGTVAEVILTTALEINYSYYIKVDQGAFSNLNGVNFEGIASDIRWQFTTKQVSSDATISSVVYTVDGTAGTITNVPENTTLEAFRSNLTPALNATFEVYSNARAAIATDLNTGYTVVVTAQDGTTKKTYTIALTTGIESNESVSVNAYPNPFSSTFTITAGRVIHNISISNLLGQKILYLIVNQLEATVYMADVPSGVYLVTIIFDDRTSTKLRVVKK